MIGAALLLPREGENAIPLSSKKRGARGELSYAKAGQQEITVYLKGCDKF
jgi:hypothetical protein